MITKEHFWEATRRFSRQQVLTSQRNLIKEIDSGLKTALKQVKAGNLSLDKVSVPLSYSHIVFPESVLKKLENRGFMLLKGIDPDKNKYLVVIEGYEHSFFDYKDYRSSLTDSI